MARKYNIIVFGATGFTGKFQVEEIVKTLAKEGSRKFTWAVSGRSADKLDEILKEVSDATGVNVKNADKVIADVGDEESLRQMAKQCDVVINCVGPYRFWGKAVVNACVEEGTSHVDVSGEPQFLEETQLLFHEKAKGKGVYIVGSCGFDSIPADIGTIFLEKNFNGDLNSVEAYLTTHDPMNSPVHYGTWHSIIHGIAHARELRPIREKLFTKSLPKSRFKLNARSILHKNEDLNSWALPFPGSDRPVVLRSQRYFYEEEKKRPIQMQAYFKLPSFISAIVLIAGVLFLGVMAQFSITRKLLEKYPRFFSFGKFSHEGPTREQANANSFTYILFGEGWSEKLLEGSDEHVEKPNKRLTIKVHGKNVGYGATNTCLLQAALSILFEKDKMPSTGGVYPPGYAFAKTTIIERLNSHGVTFTVAESRKK